LPVEQQSSLESTQIFRPYQQDFPTSQQMIFVSSEAMIVILPFAPDVESIVVVLQEGPFFFWRMQYLFHAGDISSIGDLR